jgi:hypothetical protein
MQRVFWSSLPVLAIGLGSGWSVANAAHAASPATAPEELLNTLAEIEAAANEQDLDAVMANYSQAFSSDTGFDHEQLRQTLESLWEQYNTLTYDIELLTWEANSPGRYTIETITRVEGTRIRPERRLTLTSEIESRQALESGQIVSQATLSEVSRLTSGENPPELQVQLPETLITGETYAFDAIVLEPLEGRSLMGVATEEGVTAQDFFEPRPVVLDVLSAGGLYKMGEAPSEPDQRWISAVIIREDGFVVETYRVDVATPRTAEN